MEARAGTALRAAQRLERRAAEQVGPGAAALRQRAAHLRLWALASRPYPVVVCRSCATVTGWLSADGTCDRCVRLRAVSESFADPHGSWVDLRDIRPPLGTAKRRRLSLRLRSGDDAVRREWRRLSEPGETAPILPEAGYELEVAHREEREAADDSCLVVQFSTATHRFDDDAWARLVSTRIAPGDLLVPMTFASNLPIEQLAEAWGDARNEVHELNRARYEALCRTRAESEAARAERDARHRRTADLLDEEP